MAIDDATTVTVLRASRESIPVLRTSVSAVSALRVSRDTVAVHRYYIGQATDTGLADVFWQGADHTIGDADIVMGDN